MLVRTVDKQLSSVTEKGLLDLLRFHEVEVDPPVHIQYLPSTYLHSSIRASGAIYQEDPIDTFTILVGTKFANNTSLERFQSNGTQSVGCDYIFPTDGTSIERGSILGYDFCSEKRLFDVCVDGECLANGPKSCGGCKVDPKSYGDLVARWAETVLNATLYVPWHVACYYNSFHEAIVASNSMWKERSRWFIEENPLSYFGHTECGSSIRIGEIDMADAIVFPLHRTDSRMPQSVCNYPDHRVLERSLIKAYNAGYGDLPVLWYRESLGVGDIEECSLLFQGNGCEDSWKKEFFSQEFKFGNHSCVARPPGCDDAYFFPADGEECSAYTELGRRRIDKLRRKEKLHDARVAWEEILENQANMKESDLLIFLEERSSSVPSQHNNVTGINHTIEGLQPGESSISIRQLAVPSGSAAEFASNLSYFCLGMLMAARMFKKRIHIHVKV